MKLDIEQTIKVISSSNSKPVEDSYSIQSVTTGKMDDTAGNSIKAESTREIIEHKYTGLAGSCLINTNYDQGPKVPKKRVTVILNDSESEASSKDLDSDEEDHPSDKRAMKIDRRPTK